MGEVQLRRSRGPTPQVWRIGGKEGRPAAALGVAVVGKAL